MKPEIVKVHRDDLITFLCRHGELWQIDGPREFEAMLPHLPVTADELLEACELYAPEIDYVYVFSDAEPLEEIVARVGVEGAIPITEEYLDEYVIRTVRGSDFLWIAVSDEDAANLSYVTILRYEVDDEEQEYDEIEPVFTPRESTLTRLSIENFKGIRDRVEVELRPLTLLFGANSAGKSSILHALHYAREIFERRNLSPDRTLAAGPAVDLGGFPTFVHGHDKNRRIRLGFTLNLRDVFVPNFEPVVPAGAPMSEPEPLVRGLHNAGINVVIGWSDLAAAPVVEEYCVEINDQWLATLSHQAGRREVRLCADLMHPIFVRASDHFVLADGILGLGLPEDTETGVSFLWRILSQGGCLPYLSSDGVPIDGQTDAFVGFERAISLPADYTVIEDSVTDSEVRSVISWIETTLSHLIVGPGAVLREALVAARYLGPLRETPPRNYAPPRHPDAARWPCGLGAWDLLMTASDDVVARVSSWMVDGDKMNIGYKLTRERIIELDVGEREMLQVLISQLSIDTDVESIRNSVEGLLDTARSRTRLSLEGPNNPVSLEPSDVGIGISQLLPVVVSALDDHSGLTAIEQPELHLHPAVQVAIGDLLIAGIGEGQKRFLVETHSEHLLLRLLRRIRESRDGDNAERPTLRPEHVCVVFVSQRDGTTSVEHLQINTGGDFIGHWPEGFFDERAKELF